MTQADYTAAQQAKFDKASAAFDSNPCKKTATVLAAARVALEERKRAWFHTPAGTEANLAKLRSVAKGMLDTAYDMKYFAGR